MLKVLCSDIHSLSSPCRVSRTPLITCFRQVPKCVYVRIGYLYAFARSHPQRGLTTDTCSLGGFWHCCGVAMVGTNWSGSNCIQCVHVAPKSPAHENPSARSSCLVRHSPFTGFVGVLHSGQVAECCLGTVSSLSSMVRHSQNDEQNSAGAYVCNYIYVCVKKERGRGRRRRARPGQGKGRESATR